MKSEVDVVKQLEKKNYNRGKVWIAIVCIVLAVVLLCGGTWLVFAFAYPNKLAEFTYNRGWDSYALKLYDRDYKKSNDINSLYMSLNINIKHDKYSGVVAKFETFYAGSQYKDFVKTVDEENMKSNLKPAVKATLINEDNYLKNKYIKALISTQENDKAFRFAMKETINTTPTIDNMGNYLYGEFCKTGVIDAFADNFNATLSSVEDKPIVTVLEEYFDALNTEFLNNFQVADQAYVWASGNRILAVGADLLNLYEKGVGSLDDAHVKEIMNNVNNKFKVLVMG